VSNLEAFAGVLVFDLWAGNTDMRQAVFCRAAESREYRAVFIDHGQCFNGANWAPERSQSKRSLYWPNRVYAGIAGWHSFEPWLSQIESFEEQAIWSAGRGLPGEWYGGERQSLDGLLEKLCTRRRQVASLIQSLRAEGCFPQWGQARAAS
jgi:hypothetical protein